MYWCRGAKGKKKRRRPKGGYPPGVADVYFGKINVKVEVIVNVHVNANANARAAATPKTY